MPELLTIGQFSRHTGLTTRALRLYHQAGLLAPAATSLATGYRYYSRDQLPLAQRIKALRATGLPLAEMSLVLASEEPRRVRAQLDGHRARLERQIAEAQRSLARLESLITWIEQQTQEETIVDQEKAYTCSFCAKKSPEVERMIAGPNGVLICNECIDLCTRIIGDERARSATASGDATQPA